MLTCADCSEELALYERVFASLAEAPTWDPGPELTDRILSKVLPSQVRRRWLRALGWGYGVAAAASAACAVALLAHPMSRAAIGTLGVEASQRLAGTAMFLLDALALTLVRVASGWTLLQEIGARFVPVVRVLSTLLSRPGVDLTLLTATFASGLLIWWLRPRAALTQRSRRRGIGHAGLFAL